MFGGNRVFADRTDAGTQLGKSLMPEYKDKNALVLAIPRGGVEVAYYVAQALHGELAVVVSKKLPYPRQPELAFGAVTEGGNVFLTSLAKGLKKEKIDEIIQEQLAEIERRIMSYRGGRPLPDMAGRTVIIVDDGIATGATLVPILQLCREQKAVKIVVAVPVAGASYTPEIDELADDVKVLEVPDNYFAVGQAYEDFHGLEDEEVTSLLEAYERQRSKGSSI